MNTKYKVWIECGDVILETDNLQAAVDEAALYQADGAYVTDANDRCI